MTQTPMTAQQGECPTVGSPEGWLIDSHRKQTGTTSLEESEGQGDSLNVTSLGKGKKKIDDSSQDNCHDGRGGLHTPRDSQPLRIP